MRKDKYHDIVKEALIKDGWTITHEHLKVPVGKRNIFVDIGAEKIIAAERGAEKIAVEVKGFEGASQVTEFYRALGQYNYYFVALQKQDPDRTLVLSAPTDVYDDFISDPFNEEVVNHYHVKLLVFSTELKTVVQWIK
ncbi:MAG: element excision factor XisH family protein [Bacteroidota bacterium]